MSSLKPNVYSERWFKSFHIPIDQSRTNHEVDFICSIAPPPQFRKIADVCCGMGRHARGLSQRGYSVTGIDRDSVIIARARELGGGPDYIAADLRDYQPKQDAFDVVIVMGQSFGHFDAATNCEVLHRLTTGLGQGGRLILDMWNPEFFLSHQGERDFDLADEIVHETKRVEDDRLSVRLTYSDGEEEHFEWQLFTPADVGAMAPRFSLTLIAYCTDFDLHAVPCGSNPRLQFVLERQ